MENFSGWWWKLQKKWRSLQVEMNERFSASSVNCSFLLARHIVIFLFSPVAKSVANERRRRNGNYRTRTRRYANVNVLIIIPRFFCSGSLIVVPQWKDINGFKQMPRDVSLDPCRKAIQWWLLRYDVRVWFWGDDVSQESVLQSHCVSSSFNYKIVKYATLIPQRAKRDL